MATYTDPLRSLHITAIGITSTDDPDSPVTLKLYLTRSLDQHEVAAANSSTIDGKGVFVDPRQWDQVTVSPYVRRKPIAFWLDAVAYLREEGQARREAAYWDVVHTKRHAEQLTDELPTPPDE